MEKRAHCQPPYLKYPVAHSTKIKANTATSLLATSTAKRIGFVPLLPTVPVRAVDDYHLVLFPLQRVDPPLHTPLPPPALRKLPVAMATQKYAVMVSQGPEPVTCLQSRCPPRP
jgi:hypothetical protein